MVFISSELTKRLVSEGALLESGLRSNARRLYQYLNWTLRMNNFAQTVAIMKCKESEMLVIDVELHNQIRERLYALCTPNDPSKPEPWQLVYLQSARELQINLKIDPSCLPRGVRMASTQFEHYRMAQVNVNHLKAQILQNGDRGIQWLRNSRPKYGRKKGQSPAKIKTVKQSSFYAAVSMHLKNPNITLIPIVSRTGKGFSIEFLLPVRLENDWIGVVYRNNESVMVLLDFYDITNKAILCNPGFDPSSLRWFRNSFHKLKIEPDDEEKEAVEALSPMAFEQATAMQTPNVPALNVYHQSYHSNHSLSPMQMQMQKQMQIQMQMQMQMQMQRQMQLQMQQANVSNVSRECKLSRLRLESACESHPLHHAQVIDYLFFNCW